MMEIFLSAERVIQQSLLELHGLFSSQDANADKDHPFSTRKALIKLLMAFHRQKITSSEAKAEFYSLLASFLSLLKTNLAVAVDVLRLTVKGFVHEVSLNLRSKK